MNILIDIDGTVCEDIPNEEHHRFSTAKVIDNAVEHVNELYNKGHHITFFTARCEEHRVVTHRWLVKNKFEFHCLIMNKPRGGNYIWIDNLKVESIKYNNNWDAIMDVHF